jgi:hypothetical protein
MTDAATNITAEELADLRVKAAMADYLIRDNERLEGEVATLKGIQAGSQKTIDALTDDLKKRGAQIAQGMLNLAEIAGASKQQTDALNSQTAAIKSLVAVLREQNA